MEESFATHLSNTALIKDVPPRLQAYTSFSDNLSIYDFEYEIDDNFRILVQPFGDSAQQPFRFDHLRLESNIGSREEREDEEDKEGTNVGFRKNIG